MNLLEVSVARNDTNLSITRIRTYPKTKETRG